MSQPHIYISAEVDLSTTILRLSDRDRLEWLTALLETLSEEGSIDSMRSLVNDPKYNDQP